MKPQYILLLSLFIITLACADKQDEKTSAMATLQERKIFSLDVDLDHDGDIEKVNVIEKIDSTRYIQVLKKYGFGYSGYSSNNEIIGCKTCGSKNGDPFVNLTPLSGGFELNMENSQFTFFYYADSLYLYEIDLKKKCLTANGIVEKHNKYSFTQIGIVNLIDLKKGFEIKIENKIKRTELINQQSKQVNCISTATIMHEQVNNKTSNYSLASLWVKPADDKKNILALMNHYINHELPIENKGDLLSLINPVSLYFGVSTASDNEFSFHFGVKEKMPYWVYAFKIKDEINRDPDKIKSVFNSYKYLLYNSLCKSVYHQTDVGNLVDLLILTYDDIHSNINSERILKDMYKSALITTNVLNTGDILSDSMSSEGYVSDHINTNFGVSHNDDFSPSFWAYTFWARRYKENNMKEIYDILIEVQNHYAEL